MFELTSETALAYWRDVCRTPGAVYSVTELGGGVSNTVLLLENNSGPHPHRLVLKQSLEKLRVEADWSADRRRIHRECAAMRLLSRVQPGAVPAILHEDQENCIFAMESAPPGAEAWKSRLLRGVAEPDIAAKAARLQAETIRFSWKSAELRAEFGDLSVFEQLRLDPYYAHLARRYPELAPELDWLSADCRRQVSLVHGDWSPKNILTDGQSVMAIDYEVIHFGNPAFDAAFVFNHLLLKSFHRPGDLEALLECSAVYWNTLLAALPSDADWFEASAMRHLAALLLARIDGKSPVEYLTTQEQKETVRAFARDLFAEPALNAAAALARRIEWPSPSTH